MAFCKFAPRGSFRKVRIYSSVRLEVLREAKPVGFVISCIRCASSAFSVREFLTFFFFVLEQIAFLGITTAERTTLIFQKRKMRPMNEPVSLKQNPFK